MYSQNLMIQTQNNIEACRLLYFLVK